MTPIVKLEETCHSVRGNLKQIELAVRELMEDPRFSLPPSYPAQNREMKANIMLTVRHIEDARMRIGKILQYAGDGVSILDKKKNSG